MSGFYSADKRQREAKRAKKKKEKRERKRTKSNGDSYAVAEPEALPEVKLEDVMAQHFAAPEQKKQTGQPAKLFVGGLAPEISDIELGEMFKPFGAITEAITVPDQMGGHRGFGFVTFANSNDAQKAIEELDGTEVEGQYLKVNKARPR